MIKKYIAGLLIFGMAVSSCFMPVTAKESDDIKKEIEGYESDLTESEERSEELEEEIAELEEEEEKLEREIEEQQKVVDKQQDAMALRIKYFYEESQGGDSFFESLLSATSFSDLLNRVMYEQDIYDYDETQLKEYEDAKKVLEDQQQEYLETGKELDLLVKEQEELQEELKSTISEKQEEYEKAKKKEEEEALRLAQETQIATGDPVGEFTGYSLTEDQIRGIAVICEREQGTSKSGVATEASLIANRYQLHGSKYDSIYSYVANSGWWGKKAGSRMASGHPRDSSVEIVRDVIVNGNRTLPLNIDEHDCLSDITSATNNGVAINKNDRSQYVSGVTRIHNRYGATYTFYCFAHAKGDPFGNTKD